MNLVNLRYDTSDALARIFGIAAPTTRQLLHRLPSVKTSIKETLIEDQRAISTVKKLGAMIYSSDIPSTEEFEKLIAWVVRNIKNPGSYGNQAMRIVAWLCGLEHVKQNKYRGDLTDGRRYIEGKLATVGPRTPKARILHMPLYRNITHYAIIVLNKLTGGEFKYLFVPARKFESFLVKTGRANDTNDKNPNMNYKGIDIRFDLDEEVYEWCDRNHYSYSAEDFIAALRRNA